MNAALLMLIALLGAHWFLDYAGQGDFMAKAKNLAAPLPGVPWRHVLVAHAGIHGAAVALITGVWWLGVLEFCAHVMVDKAKCCQQITYAPGPGRAHRLQVRVVGARRGARVTLA